MFKGKVISSNYFHITIKFTSNLDNSCWYVTNVYGPNSVDGKLEFVSWVQNLNINQNKLWMILGDFNFVYDSSIAPVSFCFSGLYLE